MSVTIRLARGEDAEQIQGIYAPVVQETVISFEFEPPTVSEMLRRIEMISRHFPWLVCEDGGRVLGYAYGGAHRERAGYQWSVDVSVYVHADARRIGVGRAMYTSLLELLILQGFYKSYAGITLPNEASVGLHEAMGFEPVGIYRSVGYKFGGWHDAGWWQRPLRSEDGPPPPPLEFSKVQEAPGWNEAMASGLRLLR